jgi:hypothetical protein
MPLLYGEGKQAFMRLQKKFIKRYDDDSTFAWKVPCNEPGTDLHCSSGILAESLDYFKDSRDIIPRSRPEERRPWRIVNQLLDVEDVVYAEGAAGPVI